MSHSVASVAVSYYQQRVSLLQEVLPTVLVDIVCSYLPCNVLISCGYDYTCRVWTDQWTQARIGTQHRKRAIRIADAQSADRLSDDSNDEDEDEIDEPDLHIAPTETETIDAEDADAPSTHYNAHSNELLRCTHIFDTRSDYGQCPA